MDYTHIDSSNNKWVWSGTTSDGRSWYENDDVSGAVKYLYYSTRASGWLLTATAPDLSAADPWVGNNNQVRFSGQAHGDSPDGVFHDARLYCGHDTGDPAEGCSNHPRGDGRDYYKCDNDGTVTVSCEDVVASCDCACYWNGYACDGNGNGDSRCSSGCGYDGAYCYDGGNGCADYGCDFSGDEAGPCCSASDVAATESPDGCDQEDDCQVSTTVDGCRCAETYTWNGNTYSGCTTDDHDRPWCGTSSPDCGDGDSGVGPSGYWDNCDCDNACTSWLSAHERCHDAHATGDDVSCCVGSDIRATCQLSLIHI